MPDPDDSRRRSPPIHKVVGSVLASFFGVQSSRRHQEDFTHGSPLVYVLVGLGATLVFILTVWLLVKVVLSAAGQ